VVIICSIENSTPWASIRGFDHRGPAPDADRQGNPVHGDGAIAIIREIGVDTGGSNIQFAVDPDTGGWS